MNGMNRRILAFRSFCLILSAVSRLPAEALFCVAQHLPLPHRLTRLFRSRGFYLCTPQLEPLSVYAVTPSFSGDSSVDYAAPIRIRGNCPGSECSANGSRHFLVYVLLGRQPCPCRNSSYQPRFAVSLSLLY